MVAKADTVVNPWAVVVEPFNTSVANTAVARPVSPYYFTIRAEKNCVELFHHLHKCYFDRLLQEARVSAESNSVEYSSDGYERNMCVNEVFSADVDREQ
jgi:hypothetical protein